MGWSRFDPVFGASGASHQVGNVPDPGGSAGTTKFLREDATWQTPPGGAAMAIGGAVSGGTAGSVLYVDGSGNLAQDNAAFFWTDASQKLTIGTGGLFQGANAVLDYLPTPQTLLVGPCGNTSISGTGNVGVGYISGHSLTTGGSNVYVGSNAGYSQTDGNNNMAIGASAQYWMNHGSDNVAIGSNAGTSQIGVGTTVNADVAIGSFALGNSTNGYNVCVGYKAGGNVSSGYGNVHIGATTSSTRGPTTGSQNVLIGVDCDLASATASGQLCIQNFIYGTGLTGSGSTISTGLIGIGIKAPATELDVAGRFRAVPAANTTPLTVSGYSLTGSDTHPMLNLSGTWNTTGFVDAALLVNITNTASGTTTLTGGDTGGSLLFDFQIGGTSTLQLDVLGNLIFNSASTNATNIRLNNNSTGGHSFNFFSTGSANTGGVGHFGIYDNTARSGSGRSLLDLDGNTGNMQVVGSCILNWSTNLNFTVSTTGDIGLARNAAGVLEINSGTAGTFRDLKLRTLLPAAGTASVAPVQFTSGTNLTTAAAGACEFDGSVFYETAVASARQVVNTEQTQNLSASRTFTNNTSAQAIFNATANGAITLAGSTTYEFEMLVAATGFSSSAHTINFGFGGTASYTSIGYYFDAQTGSTLATPTASATGFIAVATATAIIASSTTTGLLLYVRGTMRINAGGTVIPQLTQVTASAAAVVQPNSFFRCWPIGSNTVTNIGNWS